MTTIWAPATDSHPSLAIHGGAGARPSLLSPDEKVEYHRVLALALTAGKSILDGGGAALDAACAAVMVLEDSPLFNSAHGAALNSLGEAELDAAVMTGAGDAGAVAGATIIRNPVLAARAVMEQTEHVMMINPDAESVAAWGLTAVEREYFITPARIAQLARLKSQESVGAKHGTVGAVARDIHGDVAAATSTGGTGNQLVGRVGDTPIIGAGTWADNSTAAISCTGQGEYFLRQVTAFDVHARMRYGAQDVRTAVRQTMEELAAKGGSGGLIAMDSLGNALLVYNTEGMFCGHLERGEIRTHV